MYTLLSQRIHNIYNITNDEMINQLRTFGYTYNSVGIIRFPIAASVYKRPRQIEPRLPTQWLQSCRSTKERDSKVPVGIDTYIMMCCGMIDTKIDEREGNAHPHNISVVVLYCSCNSRIHHAWHNYSLRKKQRSEVIPQFISVSTEFKQMTSAAKVHI